jgi:membrane-associated phospholipid phosphatase
MFSLLKKNAAFFIPYFIFLLAGGVLLLLCGKTDINLYINRYNSPTADFFFGNWTSLGLGIMIIPVALVLAFIRFRYMLISLVAFVLTFIINDSLKSLFHTPRPLTVFNQLHESLHLVPGVEMYSWNSFPSGHTATGFCMFCLLALYTKNNLLKTIYFISALLVAYSRMYLSEHFLQDVYAGSIIGVGCALFTYNWIMNGQMITKFADRLDRPLINLKKVK